MKDLKLLLLFLFCSSCNDNYQDPQTFIQESKKKDLSILFNVSIEARYEGSNNEMHYYYSHTLINNDTLTVPSFEYFDDFYKKDTSTYNKIFNKLYIDKENKEKSPLIFARKYSQQIDRIYRDLNVIDIRSLPASGRFIIFTINKKFKVYYLEDSKTLNKYWQNYFTKLKKVNPKWFYEEF